MSKKRTLVLCVCVMSSSLSRMEISDKKDEETWHGGIVYRGGEKKRKIGVQIRERNYPPIQGEKENASAIEIIQARCVCAQHGADAQKYIKCDIILSSYFIL